MYSNVQDIPRNGYSGVDKWVPLVPCSYFHLKIVDVIPHHLPEMAQKD